MGRHVGKKLERKEKSKVKLRIKNAGVTKAKNLTDTSFKSRKILIREQLKNDLAVPCSKRKLTVKELLSRLQHHNLSVRQNALVDLKELMQKSQNEGLLGTHLGKILEGIAKLVLDQEREVRKSAMKLLGEFLEKVESQKMSPFFKMLLSYLGCGMTHIHPNIQEDALMMLDVLLNVAPDLVAENAFRILPNFLNMVSRLKSESKPERTLSMNLGSTHLSMKWRFNVLCYMHTLLSAMVEHYKSKKLTEDNGSSKVYFWKKDRSMYIPVYKSHYLKLCCVSDTPSSGDSESDKLKNFADVLMPLLKEIWLEALPSNTQQNLLSVDTALLLKCMVEIIQFLWELLLLWERKERSKTLSTEFASAYRKEFENHFLRGFPYTKTNTLVNEWNELVIKNKQQQKQQKQKGNNLGVLWKEKTVDENCAEINIALCNLFCSLHDPENLSVDMCRSVVEYTKCYIKFLERNPQEAVPGLMRLIRMLLMDLSKSWKKLQIDFTSLLNAVLMCSTRVKAPDAVTDELTRMFCEIAVSKDYSHLNTSVFREWMTSLPETLLRPTIHISVIRTIVELAYINDSFAEVLHHFFKHSSVLENLGKIKVIGVATEHERKVHLASIVYCLRKTDLCKRGYWEDEAATSIAEALLKMAHA